MPWARASSLERHLECGAASHLPRYDRGVWSPGYMLPEGSVFVAPTVRDDRDHSAADWGTAMHAAKALAEDATEPFLSWMEPWREKMWPSHLGQHEACVAYNCKTGEIDTLFGEADEAKRDEWKAEHGTEWVTGTTDWWGTLPSGEPWVDDLKTGWRDPVVVTPAMLFYGMVRFKYENARVEVPWETVRLSITHMPRPRKGEDPEPRRKPFWAQVTDTMLLAFEGELKNAWVRATGLKPEARPGDWCQYCPSATVCDRANS